MAVIKEFKLDGETVYFQTAASAVIFENGNTLSSEIVNISNSVQSFEAINLITSIPIDKSFIVATISANASFALASIPSTSKEIHVIIKNSGSNKITITIPNSGNYKNGGDDTILIEAGKYGEINCLCADNVVYIRGL